MKTWCGYTGKVLEVNLSNESIIKSDLDASMAKEYMGGKGFGAKILYEQLPNQIDPFSSENILVFATGPLTGTFAPASGRFEVCTKSPATGIEDFSSSEGLLKTGERVNNLVRLFNIRDGLRADLDTLPGRFFTEPLKEGPCKDRVVDLKQLKEDYYFVRGWNPDGIPTEDKLKELGI